MDGQGQQWGKDTGDRGGRGGHGVEGTGTMGRQVVRGGHMVGEERQHGAQEEAGASGQGEYRAQCRGVAVGRRCKWWGQGGQAAGGKGQATYLPYDLHPAATSLLATTFPAAAVEGDKFKTTLLQFSMHTIITDLYIFPCIKSKLSGVGGHLKI